MYEYAVNRMAVVSCSVKYAGGGGVKEIHFSIRFA